MNDDTNSKPRFGRLALTALLAVGMLLSGAAPVSAQEDVDVDAITVEPVSIDGDSGLAEFRVVNDNPRDVTVAYRSGTDKGSVTIGANSAGTFTAPIDTNLDVAIYADGEVIATTTADDLLGESQGPTVDTSELLLSAESTDGHDDLARFSVRNDDEVPAAVTYVNFDTGEYETISLDGNDVEHLTVATGEDEDVTLGLYYGGELVDVKTNAERTSDLGPKNPKDCGCHHE